MYSLITLLHCELCLWDCFPVTWPTTVGARSDKANAENRIRNWITCHPTGNENPATGDRWNRGSFWHKTAVPLLKLSLLVKWNGILMERNALADDMILAFKKHEGASLVAQWLRIRLPMQGTRVRALVWEDPTCCGATRPVSHNYWACASGACAPQQERPRWWEARAPRWRVAPTCRN